MSTYESEAETKPEPEPESESGSGDLYSTIHAIIYETLFIVAVLVGMTVFACGFAFLLLGVTTDTVPPAPYFATTTDRVLMIIISVAALGGGGGIVRWAMGIVGW
jgi:uncharacterized membrane protein